jgi:hypothetical protein
MVRRNLTQPFDFHVLTDQSFPYSTIPFIQPWQGWWGKLQLFGSPTLFPYDHVLYLDLDTVILQNIDEIFACPQPSFLKDVYVDRLGSGIVLWEGGRMFDIWKNFMKDPLFYMDKFKRGGDQAVIQELITAKYYYLQDNMKGIYSYKAEYKDGVCEDAKIVYFHGRPWISEVMEPFVAFHWR